MSCSLNRSERPKTHDPMTRVSFNSSARHRSPRRQARSSWALLEGGLVIGATRFLDRKRGCVYIFAGLFYSAMVAGCGKPAGPSASTGSNVSRTGTNAPAVKPVSTNTNAVAATNWVFDPRNFGRDPFFPQTLRIAQREARGQSNVAAMASPRLPISSYIKLSGVHPGKRQPLAMINKSIFSPGESGEVSIVLSNAENQAEIRSVLIHCLKVHGDTVEISIEGEPGTTVLRLPNKP